MILEAAFNKLYSVLVGLWKFKSVFPVNEVLYTFIYIVLGYAPVVKSNIAFNDT